MRRVFEAKFWLQPTKNQEFKLGLTREFLNSVGIFWNLGHRDITKLQLGKLFLSVESSRMLMSLRSPIDGDIVKWNEQIFNNPSEITEDTYLVRIKLCDASPATSS